MASGIPHDDLPAWVLEGASTTVERYFLGPELGHGGMGRVHEAWDPLLRRLVAIKILFGHSAEQQLRFLREARSQARLEHPNVCRILDLGTEGDRPYIVMELLRGPSLAGLDLRTDFRRLAALMADVCAGVHAAHRAGLIHRDLKPANVLVVADEQGSERPVIVDFGLAKDLLAENPSLSWAVLGTPAFMSPEQARGEALGPATDIYSLGATLYDLLTGQPPFEGATPAALISQQASAGVRSVRRLNPAVPRDLETIVLRCLELEPTGRYSSAEALGLDLRRWMAGEPIQSRPVGWAGRLWRWARRKPALAATATASLLTTTVLAGGIVRTLHQSRTREAAAQRFALEIRDAEHLLRIERMMPMHDIRPAFQRVRERMAAIRSEMEQGGPLSRGPGHYALGRALMSLREFDAARSELEQAWANGFQAPEVAYALGVSRLQMHVARQTALYHANLPKPLRLEEAQKWLAESLAWVERGRGAKVDEPEFGAALAAIAREDFDDAVRRLDRVLSHSPWLYEANLEKARALQLKLDREAHTNRGAIDWDARQKRLEPLYEEAERLAPSDEDTWSAHANFYVSLYIDQSAHRVRSAEPLARAASLLEHALAVDPDSLSLSNDASNAILQQGFLSLSTGGDPGDLCRNRALAMERLEAPADASLKALWMAHLSAMHHLWWVAADADWNFGRDPRPALKKAKALQAQLKPDTQFAFPLLIQARVLVERGQDPSEVFAEIERLLATAAPEATSSAFHDYIAGMVYHEKARWLDEAGRPLDEALRLATECLERAATKDPTLAYTFYELPRVHACRARQALRRGQATAPHVQAALRTALQGVDINPDNAQLQISLAEARLVEAEAMLAKGGDPRRPIAGARRALNHAERINPRSLLLSRTRGACDLLEARYQRSLGRDPSEALRRASQEITRGLAVRPGDPTLLKMLREAKGEAV